MGGRISRCQGGGGGWGFGRVGRPAEEVGLASCGHGHAALRRAAGRALKFIVEILRPMYTSSKLPSAVYRLYVHLSVYAIL